MHTDAIKDLAANFAANHGASVERPHDNEYYVVTLTDGTKVSFSSSWDSRGKVSVTSAPKERDHRRYDEKAPSINVDPARAPAAAVADINRRLLTAAREDCARARTYRERQDNYANAVDRNIERLGMHRSTNGSNIVCGPNLPGGTYLREVSVSTDSIGFHVSGVSIEKAERILAILKEF
jgi:hypothetical protein